MVETSVISMNVVGGLMLVDLMVGGGLWSAISASLVPHEIATKARTAITKRIRSS